MKILILSAVLAAGAVLGVAQADDQDTTGSHHYIKDSVITTKVKAKLAEKHMDSLTNIKVDTDANGSVWLSGKVPTKDAKDLAGMITKGTEGVTAVHNHLAIEQ